MEGLELDHGVFVLQDWQIFLTIYLDDLFLFIFDKSRLTDIQAQLNTVFKMTNLREVSHYSGMEVDVEVGKQVSFRQTVYLKKLLELFLMTDCKPVSISMNPGRANSLLASDQHADRTKIKVYESAIGSLIWPVIYTQSDISY